MIELILDATKRVYGLNPIQKDQIKMELTLESPAYKSAKKYSKWANVKLDQYIFYYYEPEPDCLEVPLGYTVPFPHTILEDNRAEVTVTYPECCISLRDSQRLAYKAYLEDPEKGIIVMPTGKGKSILGVYIAYKLRQKTLVIVHKDDLVRGWQKDISLVFGDKLKVGVIKASKRKIGEQITIATVQTLSRFSDLEIKAIQDEFGLIITDECFPKGTLIDGRCISDIKIGDHVMSYNHNLNVFERREVVNSFRSKPSSLVKINLSDGGEIVCTEGHPFYVPELDRYLPAVKLEGYELYSVQSKDYDSNKVAERDLQKRRKSLLLQRLFPFLYANRSFGDYDSDKPEVRFGKNEVEQSYEKSGSSKESFRFTESYRSLSEDKRWKRNWYDSATEFTTKFTTSILSMFGVRSYHFKEKRFRISKPLQNRHSITELQSCYRSGWFLPWINREKTPRPQEECTVERVRVDSVEIQEQTSDGTFGGLCPDGFVYNIEVDSNHNYLAEGVLVHNCHHCPANTYNIINKFTAPYKIGLSATPERADGLTKIMNYYLGDFAYVHKMESNDKDILPVKVLIRNSTVHYLPEVVELTNRKGNPYYELKTEEHEELEGIPITNIPFDLRPRIAFHTIDNLVVTNSGFTFQVINDVMGEYNKGRSIIMFFTQKEHCRLYHDLLIISGVPEDRVQLYYGDSTEKKDTLIERAESKEVLITLATYSIATEGTNVKSWEIAFLVSSMNSEKNTEQAVGRIRRAQEGNKNPVLVYDYRHEGVYTIRNHGVNRNRRYKKLKFKMDRPNKATTTRGYVR